VIDGPYIAEAASLIGDPARANMLAALMDGRALTATKLGLASAGRAADDQRPPRQAARGQVSVGHIER
jgi:hypothetical protein